MEIIGLVIFILDIIAIIDVFKSSKSTLAKVLWVLGILFFPVAGLLCWYLLGKK